MTFVFVVDKASGFVALVEEESDQVDVDGLPVEEEVINPILPTLNEIVWSALFFFALWAMLKFVLLPPIIAGRDARRAKVQAGKDARGEADSELAELRAAQEQRLAAARAEAARIVDEARDAASQERSEAVSAVEAQIGELRAGAAAEIAGARGQALTAARGDVGSLAVNAAGKVLNRDLDAGAYQSVLDQFLSEKP